MNKNKSIVAIVAISSIAAVAMAIELSVKLNIYTKIGSLEFGARKTGWMSLIPKPKA